MDKYEITRRIEKFAPVDTAEKWDCSGWIVETQNRDISKIMLALTVADDILSQAYSKNCDMIISHHPLFFVPLKYKNINIYSAHTNMDIAIGGTTDTLIEKLKESGLPVKKIFKDNTFVRYVETDVYFEDLGSILAKISPNFRFVKAEKAQHYKKLALCAGSGSEFIQEAFLNGADGYITGDLKFHTAVESPIPVFDIGHFESEILVLDKFQQIIGSEIETIKAVEHSPFKIYS